MFIWSTIFGKNKKVDNGKGEAVHRTLALPIHPKIHNFSFVPPSLIYFPACHPIHPPPYLSTFLPFGQKGGQTDTKGDIVFIVFIPHSSSTPLISQMAKYPNTTGFEGRFSLYPKHWPKNHGLNKPAVCLHYEHG
jgi:hypothetical protein